MSREIIRVRIIFRCLNQTRIMVENQTCDKKSLRFVTTKADWQQLAKDCIAFANAAGGRLLIGIEDDNDLPPVGQKIPDALLEQVVKKIGQHTLNVRVAPKKSIASNEAEFLELTVSRNAQGIASTTDGRYFLRVADACRPLLPDELGRLLADKEALAWELHTVSKVPASTCDKEKRAEFLRAIRQSDRVTSFVRGKSDDEILAHYFLTKAGCLTNLGILWIGRREERAALSYAPVIQFLKFDESGRKVNKIVWDDFNLNPKELIAAVWSDIPDWKESYELSDGLFRKNIPHYDEVVIREVIANALVHRPYTTRGDIFLNLYPDRLEIHNPGLLPLGVTPQNILHASQKRNEHLAKVFYDLKLMEREGSGYDRMYQAQLENGKPLPVVVEGDDRVVVTVEKRIVRPEVVEFISKAVQQFELTQRELISLGLVAQHGSLSAMEFSRILNLTEPQSIRSWLGRLPKLNLVHSKGRTRATEYSVAPEVLRSMAFKGPTTLKQIEPHRLQELIRQDLAIYQPSRIGEIHSRIGHEIPRRKLFKTLEHLMILGIVEKKGQRKHTRYSIKK
jgi:ATP-dependent DNA helicase RecG